MTTRPEDLPGVRRRTEGGRASVDYVLLSDATILALHQLGPTVRDAASSVIEAWADRREVVVPVPLPQVSTEALAAEMARRKPEPWVPNEPGLVTRNGWPDHVYRLAGGDLAVQSGNGTDEGLTIVRWHNGIVTTWALAQTWAPAGDGEGS